MLLWCSEHCSATRWFINTQKFRCHAQPIQTWHLGTKAGLHVRYATKLTSLQEMPNVITLPCCAHIAEVLQSWRLGSNTHECEREFSMACMHHHRMNLGWAEPFPNSRVQDESCVCQPLETHFKPAQLSRQSARLLALWSWVRAPRWVSYVSLILLRDS